MGLIQVVAASLSGLLALVAVVALVRDRLYGKPVLMLATLTEVVLAVHLVVGILQLSGGGGVSGATYVGYLVGVLLVLPAAVWWAAAERNRGGTAVILLGALVVPFLLLRTHDIWAAAGA
ncbi:MAG: hypothetical protein Q8Q02_13555 [Nocardioides sp.]|nr:hypothetical protein [Nocardioides sp.]